MQAKRGEPDHQVSTAAIARQEVAAEWSHLEGKLFPGRWPNPETKRTQFRQSYPQPCQIRPPPHTKPGRDAAGAPHPALQGPPGLELVSGVVEQGGLPPRQGADGVLRVVLLPILRQPAGGGGPDADGPRGRAPARGADF